MYQKVCSQPERSRLTKLKLLWPESVEPTMVFYTCLLKHQVSSLNVLTWQTLILDDRCCWYLKSWDFLNLCSSLLDLSRDNVPAFLFSNWLPEKYCYISDAKYFFFPSGKEGVGGAFFQNRPISAPRAIAVDNNTVILQSTSATSVHQSKPSTVIVQAPPSASLPTHSSGTIQVTTVPTTQNQPQIIGIVTSSSGGSTSLGNIITNTNQISTTVLSRVYGADGSTIITTAPSGNLGTTTTFFPVATSG